ncbi:MAG: protein kinase [Acidimicrobiia bacterium]|nr:protein kinase [Acidimicrobiia bacterium]
MTAGVSVGSVLADRYELTRELAGGGMGTVFIADDTLLSRPVAVKILHPELARDPGIRERFHHEALAAARLSHPGIVATYDTGDSDGVAYIVMELADGGPCARSSTSDRCHPPDVAADIAAQVADALENAHRHGVIHRDVKPGNILVRSDGRVQVVDFGIAKATGAADLTRTGMVIGTARYLAPEQAKGNAIDPRADVYSLGLVLYEMLTGQVPFTRDTDMATAAARLTNYARPVRELRPEVSPALEAVVMRALAREPADRYQNAGAFASAIRDAASGRVEEPAKPRTAPRPTPQPPPAPAYQPPVRSSPRKRHTNPMAWLLVVIALAGAAVAIAWAVQEASSNDPATTTTIPLNGP